MGISCQAALRSRLLIGSRERLYSPWALRSVACCGMLAVVAFTAGSAKVSHVCFALAFSLIWAAAVNERVTWPIAAGAIVWTAYPILAIRGLGFGMIWVIASLGLLRVFFVSRLQWRQLMSLPIALLFLAGMALSKMNATSSPFYDAGRASTLNCLVDILNRFAPILLVPMFFSYTLRTAEERLHSIILLICLSLAVMALLFFASDRGSVDEQTGWTDTYETRYSTVDVVRTQQGIIFSMCAAIALPLAILLGEDARSFVLYPAAMTALCLLLRCGARGGMIFAFVTFVIFVFLRSEGTSRRRKVLVLVGITVMAIIGFCVLCPDAARNVLESRWKALRNDRDGLRIERWQSGLRQFVREPLGVGWTLENSEDGHMSHNDFLAFGMSYGIPGFVGYILAVVSAIRRGYKDSKLQGIWGIVGTSAFLAATCLALNSMTDHLTACIPRYQTAWFLIAIGIAGDVRPSFRLVSLSNGRRARIHARTA
jgi:hypothetical protein